MKVKFELKNSGDYELNIFDKSVNKNIKGVITMEESDYMIKSHLTELIYKLQKESSEYVSSKSSVYK